MKLNLGIFSTRDIDIYDSVYLQDYVQWQQQQQLIALHLDVSLFEQDCPRFREIEQMLQVDFLHKAHQQCMAKIAVAAEWQQFLQLYQSLADLLQQYHGVDVHHSEQALSRLTLLQCQLSVKQQQTILALDYGFDRKLSDDVLRFEVNEQGECVNIAVSLG